MKLLRQTLLILLIGCLPWISWGKSPAALAPMGVFGEISELEHRIYFNTLQESLSINYSLVSQKLFEQAQEQAFNELDFEECTEEQCFALIQELLQVENLFLFQIVREGTFNQLTLTHIDLDNQRTVRTAFCEDCGIGQINRQIDDLVRKIMKATPVSYTHLRAHET